MNTRPTHASGAHPHHKPTPQPNLSQPVPLHPRFAAQHPPASQEDFLQRFITKSKTELNNWFKNTQVSWNRFLNKLEANWFRLTRFLFPVSVPKLREAIVPLVTQSATGFPVAILRTRLIRDGSPDAFLPQEALRQKYLGNNLNLAKTLENLVQAEHEAYLTASLTAMEHALASPGNLLQSRNWNPAMKSIDLAVEDANDLGSCRLRDDEQLYGQNRTPIADNLYNLILASPKVVLHEHYRGCAPIPMVRARMMEAQHHKAFIGNDDFQNYCRTDRLYTPDGEGPLYQRGLNRFRWKNDMLVSQSIYSDETAYLAAYMYTLRLGLENVRYFEYRLNPMSKNVKDPMRYVQSIQTGIDDAREFVKKTRGWDIDGNLILSADRQPKQGLDLSPKPGQKYDPRIELALKILDLTIQARQAGFRTTGFDVQGDEEGYAITDFKPVADCLKAYNRRMVREGRPEMRIGATLHAGETPRSGVVSQPDDILTGEESIAKAVELFWDKDTPVRIGHGIRVAYSPKLIQECVKKNIGFEQCPKSNVQTGAVQYYHDMPSLMLSRDYGLKVSISTDNRTTSKTDSVNELVKLTRHLGARHGDRKKFQMDGLETAFIFDEAQKNAMRRQMETLYGQIEQHADHQRIINYEFDKKTFKALIENRLN